MDTQTRLIANAGKRKRAAEILAELNRIEKDVVETTKDLRQVDGAIGLPDAAKLHFAILAAAIGQVAEGRVEGLDARVNYNVERLYQMVNDSVNVWKSRADGQAVFSKLKTIQEQLPLLIEIATQFVDYSAVAVPGRRR
jgi:archaellum component FlaC